VEIGDQPQEDVEGYELNLLEGSSVDEYEDWVLVLEEAKSAIRKLRNNRAPGADDVNAELIKLDAPELIAKIHKTVNKVLTTEIAQKWEEEGKSECQKCRSRLYLVELSLQNLHMNYNCD
jgi:hypothetical protein